jgi:methionine S-methyltransferase
LVCGLVKNRLYQDLQVCFVVSENADFVAGLTHAAELTHSRTPALSQLYYDRILQDLLNFQIADGSRGRSVAERAFTPEDGFFKKSFVQLSSQAMTAFAHPAIRGEDTARVTENAIRLDYGENSLPAPASLKRSLFEAFARLSISVTECDPAPELLELARRRFGAPDSGQVVLGGGVAPLFAEIAAHCARLGKTLVFPQGAYGYFVASAQFHGARVAQAETRAAESYKLTASSLEAALKGAGHGAFVVLSAPVVNPTGAVYSRQELKALVDVADRNGAALVLDTIFSGLEYGGEAALEPGWLGSGRWAILGGLSKEFAAGGLRVGFGISNDSEIVAAWRRGRLTAPHSALGYALKKVLGQVLQRDPVLMGELEAQATELGLRAKRLAEALKASGWEPLGSYGGLFLVASPVGLIGKKAGQTRLTMDNVADVLRERTGVMINTPGWTGVAGHFRFVLSVSHSDFESAIEGLTAFWKGLSP